MPVFARDLYACLDPVVYAVRRSISTRGHQRINPPKSPSVLPPERLGSPRRCMAGVDGNDTNVIGPRLPDRKRIAKERFHIATTTNYAERRASQFPQR